MRRILTFLGSLGLAYGVGFGSSIPTTDAIPTWYAGLVKPALTPPSIVFPIVWTTLYTFMAIASWRLFERRNEKGVRATLWLYAAHLLVNGAWSLVFFGAKLLWPSVAVIIVLWIMVLVLTVRAWKADRVSGALLVPYLLWVSFASYLNVFIALHN